MVYTKVLSVKANEVYQIISFNEDLITLKGIRFHAYNEEKVFSCNLILSRKDYGFINLYTLLIEITYFIILVIQNILNKGQIIDYKL